MFFYIKEKQIKKIDFDFLYVDENQTQFGLEP